MDRTFLRRLSVAVGVAALIACNALAQDRPVKDLSADKRQQLVATLDSKLAEAKDLSKEAGEVTKKIGELATSGKLPQDEQGIQLMRKLVDQLEGIRTRMDRVQEQVDGIEAYLKGQKDVLPKLQEEVEKQSKTKISGYIQPQYQFSTQKFPPNTATSVQNPNFDAFRLRNVRLNVEHTIDDNTKAKLSADFATGSNQLQAILKDAYATFIGKKASGTNVGTVIDFGQRPVPLGNELERSSADLEYPERVLYNSTLFNSERSRGIDIRQGINSHALFEFGAWDSLATTDPEQNGLTAGPGNDLSESARLRFFGTNYDVGISGWAGKRPAYTAAVAGALVTSPAVTRDFLYVDALIHHVLVPQLTFRAEAMVGRDRIPNVTPSAAGKAHPLSGFYNQFGWNFNSRNEADIRWQQFSPNLSVKGKAVNSLGVVYSYKINDAARISLSHELYVDNSRAANMLVQDQRQYATTVLRATFKF